MPGTALHFLIGIHSWAVWLLLVAAGPPAGITLLIIGIRFAQDERAGPVIAGLFGAGAVAVLVMAGWAALQGPLGFFRAMSRPSRLRKTKRVVRALEQSGHVRQDRVFCFTVRADGFTEVSQLRQHARGMDYYENVEWSGGWDVLAEVVVTDRNVFLLDNHQGAFIFPIRVFSHAEALDRFVGTVRGLMQAAKESAGSSPTVGPSHPGGIRKPD